MNDLLKQYIYDRTVLWSLLEKEEAKDDCDLVLCRALQNACFVLTEKIEKLSKNRASS